MCSDSSRTAEEWVMLPTWVVVAVKVCSRAEQRRVVEEKENNWFRLANFPFPLSHGTPFPMLGFLDLVQWFQWIENLSGMAPTEGGARKSPSHFDHSKHEGCSFTSSLEKLRLSDQTGVSVQLSVSTAPLFEFGHGWKTDHSDPWAYSVLEKLVRLRCHARFKTANDVV